MKSLTLAALAALSIAGLTGCETTAQVLTGVANEMERQQPQQRQTQYPQQPQQQPARRPSNASAGGIK
jgi:predicted secreted acid phosphatase